MNALLTLEEARKTYAYSLAFVMTREEFPFVLNSRKRLGCGAEVGVQEGRFSAYLLKNWPGRQLISIDLWQEQGEDYQDIANVSQSVHELFYRRTVARLRPFGERSVIWRMSSGEASRQIADHFLDFVYIDARHDYESVKQDLYLWYDKIRPGGIFAGHDYLNGRLPQGVFNVKAAVDEFFGKKGLPVFSTHKDIPFVSWMVEILAS